MFMLWVHVILHGVLPLHFKVMLRKFVEKKIFTVDELNNWIQSFAFAKNDLRNKPSSLKNLNSSDNDICQSGIVSPSDV